MQKGKAMEEHQRRFIEFLIKQEVLLFGNFTLKSGRVSPYFFNAGQFNTASSLTQLGQFYAEAIVKSNIEFDILFGPAYKGIPIVASVAIALYEKHHIDLPFCFNRKEKKPYGEGGDLIGSPLKGRVLLIDDVISAGTTFKESAELISQYPTQLIGFVTALDREEKGESNLSAINEIKQQFKVQAINIIKLQDVIDYLAADQKYANELQAILAYQQKYGSNL